MSDEEDQVIDLTERLAPYADQVPAPGWRYALIAQDQRRQRRPLRPLRAAPETTYR